jgi:hypothetical protein
MGGVLLTLVSQPKVMKFGLCLSLVPMSATGIGMKAFVLVRILLMRSPLADRANKMPSLIMQSVLIVLIGFS